MTRQHPRSELSVAAPVGSAVSLGSAADGDAAPVPLVSVSLVSVPLVSVPLVSVLLVSVLWRARGAGVPWSGSSSPR